jgi:hypothetical protein
MDENIARYDFFARLTDMRNDSRIFKPTLSKQPNVQKQFGGTKLIEMFSSIL